jgi:site-specific recombinase XerD
MITNPLKLSMQLFQRKNGFWYIRFTGDRWLSLKTKEEKRAHILFSQAEREFLESRVVSLDKIPKTTVKQFFEEYDTWCQGNHKASTYSREKRIFKKFRDFIDGKMALHAVTQRDGERYILYCKRLKNKETSINIELRTLKAAFKKAIEWKYLKESPFRHVKLLKYTREIRFIEQLDQIESIFEAIASEGKKETQRIYRLVFALYVYTGARRGEIWKLQWKDIGDDAIIFRDRKNYEMLKVPIVAKLSDVLSEHNRGVGRLIPVTLDQMSRRMKYYLKKAGLGNLKPHDLRHTFASHLLMSGVPLETVQKLLGHSSIQATQIYTHLTEDHKRQAIHKLPYGS